MVDRANSKIAAVFCPFPPWDLGRSGYVAEIFGAQSCKTDAGRHLNANNGIVEDNGLRANLGHYLSCSRVK